MMYVVPLIMYDLSCEVDLETLRDTQWTTRFI
jgi:hypothetical protein